MGGGGFVVRDPRLLSSSPLSQYLITRPRQEKPPNLNSERSVWFTAVDVLMFKYRQEQRHKMTQHILSQQKVTAHTLTPRPTCCLALWHNYDGGETSFPLTYVYLTVWWGLNEHPGLFSSGELRRCVFLYPTVHVASLPTDGYNVCVCVCAHYCIGWISGLSPIRNMLAVRARWENNQAFFLRTDLSLGDGGCIHIRPSSQRHSWYNTWGWQDNAPHISTTGLRIGCQWKLASKRTAGEKRLNFREKDSK